MEDTKVLQMIKVANTSLHQIPAMHDPMSRWLGDQEIT